MSVLKRPRVHDDLLNFRLKRLLTLGAAPALRLCEGGFGVARSEWALVARLVEHGPMSPSELAVRTTLEPARASRTIARLVERGFVERISNTVDRRRATLHATAAGERLYAGLFPGLAAINARIAAVLSDAEAAEFERLLDKLTVHARDILKEDGGGIEARTNRHLGGARRSAIVDAA